MGNVLDNGNSRSTIKKKEVTLGGNERKEVKLMTDFLFFWKRIVPLDR